MGPGPLVYAARRPRNQAEPSGTKPGTKLPGTAIYSIWWVRAPRHEGLLPRCMQQRGPGTNRNQSEPTQEPRALYARIYSVRWARTLSILLWDFKRAIWDGCYLGGCFGQQIRHCNNFQFSSFFTLFPPMVYHLFCGIWRWVWRGLV